MFQALDGPSAQDTISVGTGTVVEVKVGASPLEERKVVTIQPKDGKIYVYFGDGVSTPSIGTMAADGFIQVKSSLRSYEAAKSQAVFILAVSGTVNVTIAERA